MNQIKLWAIHCSKLTKLKGNLLHRSLLNAVKLYCHTWLAKALLLWSLITCKVCH